MILVGEASSALAFKLLGSHSMKYSRVKFRKNRASRRSMAISPKPSSAAFGR
jgi:hypothetical protein